MIQRSHDKGAPLSARRTTGSFALRFQFVNLMGMR
jgi:hypothetical protein